MFCFLYAKIFNLDQFCHVIHSYISKPFITQSRVLMTLKKKKPSENIVGKGENAGNQHFLLFTQCFPPIPKRISVLKLH